MAGGAQRRQHRLGAAAEPVLQAQDHRLAALVGNPLDPPVEQHPRAKQVLARPEPRHLMAAPQDRDRLARRRCEARNDRPLSATRAAARFSYSPARRRSAVASSILRSAWRAAGSTSKAKPGQPADRIGADADLALGVDDHREFARRPSCRGRASARRCAGRRSAGSAAREARRRASPRPPWSARPWSPDRPASRRGGRYRPRSAPRRSGRRACRCRPGRCRAGRPARHTSLAGCGRRLRSDG